MQLINRDCLVVREKQTFVDWLRSVPELKMPDVTLDDIADEETILLVPEGDGAEDALAYIEPFKPGLAAKFFWDWYMDESVWPDLEKRPFDHWFELEYSSVVYDMAVGMAIRKDTDSEFEQPESEINIRPYRHRILAEFERTDEWGTPEDPNMIGAYRAIQEYANRSGDVEGILDLQLTFVEGGTGYALRYGDINQPYCEAVEMVLDDFVALAREYPALYKRAELTIRLQNLVEDAEQIGWGYGDSVREQIETLQNHMDALPFGATQGDK